MGTKILSTGEAPERLLGKSFGAEGLLAVRDEIRSASGLTRAEIARRVCRRLGWRNAGGRYQFMSARVGLLRLYRMGLIELPAPTRSNGNGRPLVRAKGPLPLPQPIEKRVDELKGLSLEVVKGKRLSHLYNALMDQYHYLGYKPLPGAQIRYLIWSNQQILGGLGFGAAAWKLAPRDQHIGWDREVRERNLHLIVNNSRFLILPWVRSPNLASHILGRCARLIPKDFFDLYGYAPVMLETFVEEKRFRGTCYRASNWTCLGLTQGRGKKHVYGQLGVPVKTIWTYALRRDFRRILLAKGNR